jgi:hypothetical protein
MEEGHGARRRQESGRQRNTEEGLNSFHSFFASVKYESTSPPNWKYFLVAETRIDMFLRLFSPTFNQAWQTDHSEHATKVICHLQGKDLHGAQIDLLEAFF